MFVLSIKNLHLEKKRILLLNTKKTLNNFWGWIRTQVIYYIPKMYNKIKNYFYNFRIERKKEEQKQTLLNLLQKVKEDQMTNTHRIERKRKWLREQVRQQRIQKEKYKLKKQYDIQKQEYITYLNKEKTLQNKQTLLSSKYAYLNNRFTLLNTFQRLILIAVTSWNNKLYAMTQPVKDLFNVKIINPIVELSKIYYKKLSKATLRRYNQSQRVIKRRFVEPDLFKKLKQQYKRDRNGLFQKITQILTQREMKRQVYIHLFCIKTMQTAFEKVKSYVNLTYLNFTSKVIFASKFKIQNYLINFNKNLYTFNLFKYNLNEYFKVLVNLLIYKKSGQHFLLKNDNEILPYSKINFIELKRILSNS